MYAQIFKPITTALRQVTMREIACTIERVERYLQYKYCRHGWDQAYQNNRNIKIGGGWTLRFGVQTLMGGEGAVQI